MNTRIGSSSGMTLVEIVIGLTLFTAFATSAFLAIERSSHSYRTESVVARLDAQTREALDEASERLREADFDSVTPLPVAATAPASASSIDFQRARGFVGGLVDWGPTERLAFEHDPTDADDGLDNDGDGLVDEGRLVWIENPGGGSELRTVLCSHVSESLEGELPGNGLDDNGNGLVDELGFCIDFAGSRAIVRITLEERDGDGSLIRQTSSRAVMSRNTPEK